MKELQKELLLSLCKALENESKLKRKSVLERLHEETIHKLETNDDANAWFEHIFKPVLQCFYDNAEICRELSVKLITEFIPKLNSLHSYLAYIMAVLVKRIGAGSTVESSEEVRLLLIALLHRIIKKSEGSIFPYNDDITKIICTCLEDSYPLIKIESCECIISLTKAIPKQFHVQCGSYITALLPGMSHKHSKVRISSIKATGEVVQYGTHGIVEKVVAPLAERLYDSNPAVRKSVIFIGGQWLKKLPDRYSQFARILPLVLTGLDDEMYEVREEAQTQWLAAGEQFLNENEDSFKKQVDYLPDTLPPDYSFNDTRPPLGCRLLAQQEASKIFPAALSELNDWTLAVQLQAASLICQLVRHIEHHNIQHAHRIWPELTLLCGQSEIDQRLQNQVEEVARLLGYFLPCSSLLNIALPQPQLTGGQLHCLACALHGVPLLIDPELSTLTSALSITASTSMQLTYQTDMLKCVSETLRAIDKGQELRNNDPCSESVSLALFTTLLVPQGLENEQLTAEASTLLNLVAKVAGKETTKNLFAQHGQSILRDIQETIAVWTDVCAEKSQFSAFVIGAGFGIGSHLDLISDILVLWNEKASTAKSLADLVRIAKPLLSWKFLQDCQVDPQPFLNRILMGAVVPGLVWHAGRLAEVKRSQTLLILLIIISEPLPEKFLTPLAQPLLPLLCGALEETNKRIRHHSAQALTTLLPIWGLNLSAQQVYKTCNALSARLDDAFPEVRLEALAALQKLLLRLPDDHEAMDSFIPLEGVQKSLLIHIDDPDPVYKQAILDALKNLGKIGTTQLLELLNRSMKHFKNQDSCIILKSYLDELVHKSLLS